MDSLHELCDDINLNAHRVSVDVAKRNLEILDETVVFGRVRAVAKPSCSGMTEIREKPQILQAFSGILGSAVCLLPQGPGQRQGRVARAWCIV